MKLFFLNLKVSAKLLVCFSLIAFVSLAVGLVGIFNIMRLQEMDNDLYVYQTLPLQELRIINGSFEQNRAYMRDMILEDNPQKVSSYLQAMEENTKKIDHSLQVFSQSLLTQNEKKEFQYFSNVLENFGYHKAQVIELCNIGNKKFAQTVLANDGPKLSANFSKAIDSLSQMKENTGKQTAELNKKRSHTAIWVTGVLVVFACLLALVLGISIARIISRPLGAVAAAAHEIARGELTCEIPPQYIASKDEVGQLGLAFSMMTANLRILVKEVHQSAEQVAASSEELTASADESAQASGQIATTITEIAQGADKQLSALSEAVSVINEMSSGVQQISANNSIVTDTVDKTSFAALEGGKAVDLVVSTMADIKRSVNHSSIVVAELGARSQEIGQIVSTISSIARQTNLLALNAAIEAARAGEQGRGFAVVAEEVRKLAEESQEATKEISKLISTIQHDTDNAVTAMSEETREVNVGSEVVNKAGKAFTDIAILVQEVSVQIKKNSAAIEKMAYNSRSIVDLVREVDQISRKTAGETQAVSAAMEEQSATMEEMASSSEVLSKLAEQLEQVVNQFKI